MAAPKNKPPSQKFLRMKALEAENREIKERLGLDDIELTFEDWCRSMPQELRDGIAARSLSTNWGNENGALKLIGFHIGKGTLYAGDSLVKLKQDVFGTEGVKAILASTLRDVEEQKQDLIRRQTQIALHGDDEASSRAFTQLSKVAGWVKPGDVIIDNRSQNLFAIANAGTTNRRAQEIALEPGEEGIGFLDHEPGEAVRVTSDDEEIEALMEGRG